MDDDVEFPLDGFDLGKHCLGESADGENLYTIATQFQTIWEEWVVDITQHFAEMVTNGMILMISMCPQSAPKELKNPSSQAPLIIFSTEEETGTKTTSKMASTLMHYRTHLIYRSSIKRKSENEIK